tara:strand:+ start:2720 stop:3019 length:300 start_codon:yes stop_codon:yes gene_type:complete
MIKRIIQFLKNSMMPASDDRIVFLQNQIALLALKVVNLERQQAVNLQTINDLVKFENDILKVIDFAGELAENPTDMLDESLKGSDFILYSLLDDDEFMN